MWFFFSPSFLLLCECNTNWIGRFSWCCCLLLFGMMYAILRTFNNHMLRTILQIYSHTDHLQFIVAVAAAAAFCHLSLLVHTKTKVVMCMHGFQTPSEKERQIQAFTLVSFKHTHSHTHVLTKEMWCANTHLVFGVQDAPLKDDLILSLSLTKRWKSYIETTNGQITKWAHKRAYNNSTKWNTRYHWHNWCQSHFLVAIRAWIVPHGTGLHFNFNNHQIIAWVKSISIQNAHNSINECDFSVVSFIRRLLMRYSTLRKSSKLKVFFN